MIDALLARLEREAEAEIARVVEEGRARAASIAAEAEARGARRREEAECAQRAAGRVRVEAAVADARHAARQRILVARAQLLERVFAAVETSLADLASGAAYEDAVSRDVERALAFTGTGRSVLHCAPGLARRLRARVHQNGRLTVSGDSGVGAGFRLVTADGRLEVDGTLAGLAERERPRLALEALAALQADVKE